MFVGYATDHTGDTYQIWDPDTSQVHESHDAIWLKWMFYSKPTINHDFTIVNEEDEDIEIVIPQHKAGESTDAEADPVPTDDSLGERESVQDDDSLSKSSVRTKPATGTSTRSGRMINKPA
jgi:hypothetical protein